MHQALAGRTRARVMRVENGTKLSILKSITPDRNNNQPFPVYFVGNSTAWRGYA